MYFSRTLFACLAATPRTGLGFGFVAKVTRAAPPTPKRSCHSTVVPPHGIRSYVSAPAPPFGSGPAPPRLPPDEQAEFDRLVREAAASAAAASLADAVAAENARREAEAAAKEAPHAAVATAAVAAAKARPPEPTPASALNGNPIEGVWRGAPPEFTGDRNPQTGEVGGPKNEPLRWGSEGDWSYNGKVTDF